jgi:predicted P-loop ATPase
METREMKIQSEQNPVTNYLASLVWDEVPRLDRWLIDLAGAEDTAAVRKASRLILIAAVRRARSPGCHFDQMPILVGPQGCGKSRALQLLAVDDRWFTDQPLSSVARSLIETTQGKWIVEASEIGKASEIGADLKGVLSRSVSEARMPYQTERLRVPHAFVVVGTTEDSDFLTEPTSARRFRPIVRVKRFDLARLAELRDQLWAEAAVAEISGESIALEATDAPA